MSHCIVLTNEDGTVSVVGPFHRQNRAMEIWEDVIAPMVGEGIDGQVIGMEPWRTVVHELDEEFRK